MSYLRRILAGATAGAAGTTALNAVTYLDMAVRARPASDTPQRAIDALASRAGYPVPGDEQTRQNRLAGLGSLAGIATGVGIGILAGLSSPLLQRLSAPVATAVIGAAAMGLTDGPLISLELTSPCMWSGADWLSDVIPHLAYGAAAYAVLNTVEP
jgi:hypothetical protein